MAGQHGEARWPARLATIAGERVPPEGLHLLAEFNESQRDHAIQRFGVLRQYLENGLSLAQLSREHNISRRTLHHWLQAYRQHGLVGLVRKSRDDRGRRLLPTELEHLIEGLALRRPPLSRAAVYRETAAVARAHGWREPSYDTVYDVIRHLPKALVTLAHEGPKAYADRFELLYRREASRPNEMWQADHTPLDLWLVDEHNRPDAATAELQMECKVIVPQFFTVSNLDFLGTPLTLK
jgi:putative transposase